MELLTPSITLLFWTIASFFMILLALIALISVLKSTFKDANNKLIWTLVILFMPFIGATLYFTIGRKQRQIVK